MESNIEIDIAIFLSTNSKLSLKNKEKAQTTAKFLLKLLREVNTSFEIIKNFHDNVQFEDMLEEDLINLSKLIETDSDYNIIMLIYNVFMECDKIKIKKFITENKELLDLF